MKFLIVFFCLVSSIANASDCSRWLIADRESEFGSILCALVEDECEKSIDRANARKRELIEEMQSALRSKGIDPNAVAIRSELNKICRRFPKWDIFDIVEEIARK